MGPLLRFQFLYVLRFACSSVLLSVLQSDVGALVGQNVKLFSGTPLWGQDYPDIAPSQTA
jgi:hypothetical protein